MDYPFIADRTKRLNEFNRILKERKLKPLRKLGDSRVKGEIELMRILAIHDHNKKYDTAIEFEARDWTKRVLHWTLYWSVNSLESDGNVYVLIVNDQYLLTKQHRPALGKWKKGLPRGWHWPLPKRSTKKKLFEEIQISDLPIETLYRKLGEELVRSMDVSEVVSLGQLASNDGRDTATPDFWLVRAQIDQKVLDKRMKEITDEGVKIVLMTKEEVEADIGKSDGISDSLSIAGIHLAQKYLNQK